MTEMDDILCHYDAFLVEWQQRVERALERQAENARIMCALERQAEQQRVADEAARKERARILLVERERVAAEAQRAAAAKAARDAAVWRTQIKVRDNKLRIVDRAPLVADAR
jgi:hypothetical protein